MSIYKACDIRGQYGGDLTLWHAERLALALSTLYPPGPILVGGDGRLSTPALKGRLVKHLVRLGWRVLDLGRVTTPLFYHARTALKVELGVMITASHNPAADNGFKLTLGPLPVRDEDVAGLARVMEEGGALADHTGGSHQRLNLFPAYLNFLKALTPDLSGMKVVVDCSNGVGGLVARKAWRRTHAQLTYLLEKVDGHFPAHAPNQSDPKNLALLAETVLETQSDLGVAYDGDADRVSFVDERGRVLSGDAAIVLFARDMLAQGHQTLVYDQKCSRAVPESIRRLGGEAVMERSGHTYIKRAFLIHNAVYAGELSGHHFLREAGGDDGIAASLIFARMLRDSEQPLSSLVDTVPVYPITPDFRLPLPAAGVQVLIAELTAAFQNEAHLDTLDGLRVEFPDGWGLVRPSVTEPLMTLRFEGVDESALRRILARFEGASEALRGRLLATRGG
jgi:phosphomannomutase / phosphoglucomutase